MMNFAFRPPGRKDRFLAAAKKRLLNAGTPAEKIKSFVVKNLAITLFVTDEAKGKVEGKDKGKDTRNDRKTRM